MSFVERSLGGNVACINLTDSAIFYLESLDSLTNDLLYSYQTKVQTYQMFGDFYRANVALEMALYISDSLKESKSGVLNDLGANEMFIGNLEKAETYFTALISDVNISQNLSAVGHVNLTNLYLDLGKLSKAKVAWEEVQRYIENVNIEEELLIPDFLQIKSRLQEVEGYQQQSIETLKKTLELLERQSLESLKAEKFRCDLVVLLLEEDVEEALKECRKTYHYFNTQTEMLKDPHRMVSTHLLAQVFFEKYRKSDQIALLDSCLLYCKKAQEVSDVLRDGFLYRNSKYFLSKYIDKNVALGIDAANELIERGEAEQGQQLFFYFMEKGKSQVLRDELEEKQRVRLKGKGLLEELYTLELRKMETQDSTESIMLSKQIEKAKSDLKRGNSEMSNRENSFHPDLDHLVQLSKQSNTVFLEFGEGKMHPYVLIVSDGQVSQKRIMVSKDSLDVLIKRHLLHLKKPTVSAIEYSVTANKLYTLLLEPFAIEKRNVVVIPSELIGSLPFASLVMNPTSVNSYKKLHYAIEECEFSYAFSSAFLPDMKLEVKQSFCGVLPVNQDEGDLSVHEALISSVKNKFRGVAFQKDSNLNLSSISEQHDFIHISSHGTFSREDPNKSFLYMPGSELSKITLEKLYSTVINNTPFVVLNACETGEGEIRTGEGIDNFTRAFFYSGASGVVESSWKINANQTAAIFNSFYNSLFNGENTKAALRDAKLTYLKDQNTDNHFAHPYYWAGFRHFGTAVILEKPAQEIPYLFLITVAIVLIILGLVLWKKSRKKTTVRMI